MADEEEAGAQRSGDRSDCHSLWIGPRLPASARACLGSFLRHGHRVIVHSYAPIASLPAGVENRDAARILPESAIVRHHRTNSVSLFSNYFRYKLAERARGFWIDCDIYCLRPFDFPDELVFGWENETQINGAVLRLVPGSALHRDLVALFQEKSPQFQWFSTSQRIRARARSLYHRKPLITQLPWGAAGPRAITWLARKHGLQNKAQPVEVFYPVSYDDAGKLCLRDFDMAEAAGARTVAIHLWNQHLVDQKSAVEDGSFLARLACEAEGGPPAAVLRG